MIRKSNSNIVYLIILVIDMKKLNLFLLLLSMFLILESASCTKVKELEYKGIDKVSVQSASLSNMSLKVNLKYYNPNSFGIDVKQTQLSLYLNNHFIGLADQPEKTQIPKKSDFLFPVIVHFDPFKALGTAFSSIFSKKNQLTIQGSAKLGKGGVYITVPLNITEDISISQ